jgi:hypothetical protein
MELAKVLLARSIRLFDVEELNPAGLHIVPLIDAIAKRYRFATHPTKPDELDTGKGVVFTEGSFATRSGDVRVGLKIFNDGLVADTRSDTDDSDAFLDDLLAWAKEEFRLGNERHILKPKRVHRSELVVFAPSLRLIGACERLDKFAQSLGNLMKTPLSLVSVKLGSDAKNLIEFVVERRVNVDFSDDKYFAAASLTTKDHLAALGDFETSMS